MEPDRFDLTVRAIGRRGVLAGIFAATAATRALPLRGAWAVGEPCPERGPGERCRTGGQCCSSRCQRRRGKRMGRCRCSPLRAPCAEDRDCCGFNPLESGHPVCDVRGVGPPARSCCMLNLAPCQSSHDCCSPFACDAGGFCRPE